MTDETTQRAQEAFRASKFSYRAQLRSEVFQLRHEAGLHKLLDLAREMRVQALCDLSEGTKEKFDTNQAAWRAWNEVVETIEHGPRTLTKPHEIKPGDFT